VLKTLVRQERAPVVARVLLALDHLARGEQAEAERHLHKALELAPQAAQALNNLAFLLAHVSPRDRPRALAVMNAVLRRWPDQPNFRDTRGQILAQMRHWEAARTDLEAALPGLANKEGTHRTLAETYEHLGQPERAAEHRRQAAVPPRETPGKFP
jgi:uncharacterized protein HemY